jgi:hypothetical protein
MQLKKVRTLMAELETVKIQVEAVKMREQLKCQIVEIKYMSIPKPFTLSYRLGFIAAKNDRDEHAIPREITDKYNQLHDRFKKMMSRCKKFLDAKREEQHRNQLDEQSRNPTFRPGPPMVAPEKSMEEQNFSASALLSSCILEALRIGLVRFYVTSLNPLELEVLGQRESRIARLAH